MSRRMRVLTQQAGTLNWYTNLISTRTAEYRIAPGIDGGTPGGLPFTYPFSGAGLAWPESMRHAVLDAILRGIAPAPAAAGWDIGLFGSGADHTELVAPGYSRAALTFGSPLDIAASGAPVAGVRASSATTWFVTLTDQDIRGVVLFDATTTAEVVRGFDTELAGVSPGTATFQVDTYVGGTVWALTGPYSPAAAVLDALINGAGYTPPSAHYLGFMEAFAFTPTELSAAGYVRRAISFGAPSGGQVANTAALNWTAGAHWPTSTWTIWDAPTGGTILWQGNDGSIAPMNAGDRLLIDVGAVKARVL